MGDGAEDLCRRGTRNVIGSPLVPPDQSSHEILQRIAIAESPRSPSQETAILKISGRFDGQPRWDKTEPF